MAILSCSRRTDIPCYYSEWFYNRLRERYFMVRNPMNPKQITRCEFKNSDIDCIVFWTKNPKPMIGRIKELTGYNYYFQYTLNGYGTEIEKHIPSKRHCIETFKELYEKGNGHIIWRYDPIIFTKKYTPEFHLNNFESIAKELKGYTSKCVISFVDRTSCNADFLNSIGEYQLAKPALDKFCKSLSGIAKNYGIRLTACAEKADLAKWDIEKAKCIDDEYIERLIGFPVHNNKATGQRELCNCIASVEMGAYSTCANGCGYCYASKGKTALDFNLKRYDPKSPMLCDKVIGYEKVSVKRLKTVVDYKSFECRNQLSFF